MFCLMLRALFLKVVFSDVVMMDSSKLRYEEIRVMWLNVQHP